MCDGVRKGERDEAHTQSEQDATTSAAPRPRPGEVLRGPRGSSSSAPSPASAPPSGPPPAAAAPGGPLDGAPRARPRRLLEGAVAVLPAVGGRTGRALGARGGAGAVGRRVLVFFLSSVLGYLAAWRCIRYSN
jgi:hypothetical protein